MPRRIPLHSSTSSRSAAADSRPVVFNVAPARAPGKEWKDGLAVAPTAPTDGWLFADKQTRAKEPRGDPSAIMAELAEFEAIADAFER